MRKDKRDSLGLNLALSLTSSVSLLMPQFPYLYNGIALIYRVVTRLK